MKTLILLSLLSASALAQSTNQAELPPPLPVSPGGAKVALTITNGVPEAPKLKVRRTKNYITTCPDCHTAQTNAPTKLKCIGESETGVPGMVRPQYEGEFHCTNCALDYLKNWYGQPQPDTPVVEVMEVKP